MGRSCALVLPLLLCCATLARAEGDVATVTSRLRVVEAERDPAFGQRSTFVTVEAVDVPVVDVVRALASFYPFGVRIDPTFMVPVTVTLERVPFHVALEVVVRLAGGTLRYG